MSKTGRYVYVPNVIIDELNNIKIEDGIDSRAEAFKKMRIYSILGRQTAKRRPMEFPIGKL